jgi:isoquinoline 1-oxidoreductase beta subunit
VAWTAHRPTGVGAGLALFEFADALVCHALEVEVASHALVVRRLVVACDCGTVINPGQARAQLEGGALMALSAALGEAMTFTAGAADQTNFDTYRLLRMKQAPMVETLLLETSRARIGGIGEAAVPGLAAALANAVFAATGRRIRTLPFTAAGFSV